MTELGIAKTQMLSDFFIASSKFNFKAVFLHNGDSFSSISLLHATGMKTTYKLIIQPSV